ncbi:MAG: metallo-mystery pair system four-Cys motif protein, partial [Gammaproteobacteria bacterium]|nr:metallo-mystery pair system four-Cys motif protein [Gammaproteobacteria bacterium]
GMSWVWLGGHKFFKVDGVGDPGGANTSFHVHVGSTGCYNTTGNKKNAPSFECAYPNTPRICLSNFDMENQKVTIDLEALLADSDVTVNNGGAAGCMSGNSDPECPAILPRLGINFIQDDGANPVTPYPAIDPQPVFGAAEM